MSEVKEVKIKISQPCPTELWLEVLKSANNWAGLKWNAKITTTEHDTILTLTKKSEHEGRS